MSQISPIDTLPIEVLIRVFAHCDYETRLSLAGVCRNWRYFSLDTLTLWNPIDLSLPDVPPTSSVRPVLEGIIRNAQRLNRPISAFADIFGMDKPKLQAVAEALYQHVPLETFRDLVALEPFNIDGEHGHISHPYINVNGAISFEGPLKLAWVHRTRDEDTPNPFTIPHPGINKDEDPIFLSTLSLEVSSTHSKGEQGPEFEPKHVINDEVFTSISPTLDGAGITKGEEWFIIHTHLNSARGRLDSIAFANWGNLVGIQLALPGTYQYLHILENAPQLRIVSLTFDSAPIIMDDQFLFPDQPFGFKGPCSIQLPNLNTLSISFQGPCFEDFPSSWNFLDSIKVTSLEGFSFTSSHLIDNPMADTEFYRLTNILKGSTGGVPDTVLQWHISAYYALYKFIRRSGSRVNQPEGICQIVGGFECGCYGTNGQLE